ncbi:hypothetical protein K488DRAFT_68967 [Vararia minispora EC-137]|uniref:Uncharacterized protein n=1 Tax=Vararia minispora EC-137 TaxID=1314806 RepID=A0ACB8QT59_9AGAM|nr:hypothetical protein K488DRAFT_68967 [Vararia minispora EC-137]
MALAQPQVAILGGGLTGLSAAFHLARRNPHVHVTVYEKTPRFGGWVRSERVEINLLDIRDQVLITAKSSPAVRARFLSLPGSNGLSMLPSSLWSLFTTRLGLLILSSVIMEVIWPANRPAGITDESVDSFFTRRFGSAFAKILGSSLVHGIYAADSRTLSVCAAFPSLWAAEERGAGSVVWGEIGPRAWWSASRRAKEAREKEDTECWELGTDAAFQKRLKSAALLSFTDGMETLIKALVSALDALPNVSLKPESDVTSLSHDGHALSAPPHLLANPAQTVAVLNFVFPTARLRRPLHQPGFGYLIPRPATGYTALSPATSPGLLGIVFDTTSLAEQDRALLPVPPESARAFTPPFVKLTAMVGGPYGIPDALDERELTDGVLGRMSTQLGGVNFPRPVFTRLHVNKDAIPTFHVGHLERMGEMRDVCEKEWEGRLKVVGAGVGGPSVGDCLRAGREAARELVFDV